MKARYSQYPHWEGLKKSKDDEQSISEAIIAGGGALNESLDASGEWSGIICDGVYGDTLVFGDLIYLNEADQRWEKTDADAEATAGDVMLGMALESGTDGQTKKIFLYGYIRLDTWNFTSYGHTLYVSCTAGEMTQTRPNEAGDIVRVVGYAHDDADTIFFNPSGTWPESVAEFLGLTDTPAAYAGGSGKAAVVKATEDGLEFAAPTPADHTLASHSTKPHSDLTDVTASQHHTKYTDAEAKAIKLDDFTAPDDNTDLDATAALHGLMPKVDKEKLDGVEAGATVYPDTGEQAFLDADHAKLDAIEAEADVTDATNVDGAGAVMEADFNAKGDLLSASADDTPELLSVGTNGQKIKAASGETSGLDWVDDVAGITFVIGDGVNEIATGNKGGFPIPFACTIVAVTMGALESGSIVVDIWKDTYANYPPTVADTITSAAKPTISATTKDYDATLTGWTTAIAADDWLYFNVDSCTTITQVTISLKVVKT